MVRTAQYVSPIGRLHLAERDEKLIGIWIEGQKYFPVSLEEVQEDAASPVLRQAAAWLDRYFQKKRPAPQELPLAPEGSGFRKEHCFLQHLISYFPFCLYGHNRSS